MTPSTNSLNLWLWWTGANFAAVMLAILAVLPFAVDLARTDRPPWLVGAIGGAALGLTLGLAQAWIGRRSLPAVGQWTLVSLVGATLGLALGMQIADGLPLPTVAKSMTLVNASISSLTVALPVAVTGALFGLVLGGFQWLLLRTTLPQNGRWVIANALGWAAGFGLAALSVDRLGVIGWLVIAGLTNGAITGWLLTQMVHKDE